MTNVSVSCAPSGVADALYYFPFDGDAKDYSGNNRDFTVSGATLTTDRRGNPNGAYQFDGTASFMTADGAGLPVGNAARTMTMWVYPTDGGGGTGIFYQGNNDCTGKMFGIGRSNAKALFWGGCADVAATTDVPLNTWTFVGVTFTPPNTVKIYTGTTEETFTMNGLGTTASALWLGGETTTNSSGNFRNHFAGKIDEVRIYHRALTTAEMATLANLP